MNGQGKVEVEAILVPRHFALKLDATLDGTAAMQLMMLLAEWDDDAAGGFVGAVRSALVEANGGKTIELPQPVKHDDDQDDDDEDGGGGTPAVVGPDRPPGSPDPDTPDAEA